MHLDTGPPSLALTRLRTRHVRKGESRVGRVLTLWTKGLPLPTSPDFVFTDDMGVACGWDFDIDVLLPGGRF